MRLGVLYVTNVSYVEQVLCGREPAGAARNESCKEGDHNRAPYYYSCTNTPHFGGNALHSVRVEKQHMFVSFEFWS